MFFCEFQDTFAALAAKLDSEKRNLENVNKTIASTSEAIHVANEDLEIAASEQKEAKTLLDSLHDQEVQVHAQAEKLTAIAEAAQQDSEKLHGRLDYSRSVRLQTIPQTAQNVFLYFPHLVMFGSINSL